MTERSALMERLAGDLAPISKLSELEAGRLSESCLTFLLESTSPDEFNVTLGKSVHLVVLHFASLHR